MHQGLKPTLSGARTSGTIERQAPGGMCREVFTLCPQLIIKTGGSTMTACNDQPTAANPTCGWAADQSGARIPASQGFCCSCTSSQLLAATVKGSSAGALCNQES